MSKLKCTFIVAIASLCFLVSSGEQTAIAKKPVSPGTPTYYGNQTVSRSHRVRTPRVYSHPNKQPSKTYLQAHPDAGVAAPKQKSDFNPPSYGSGTAIRIKDSKEFGDIRDVLGVTNRKR